MTSFPTITEQPQGVPEPSVVEAARPIPRSKNPSVFRRFGRSVRGVAHFMYDVLVLLSIGLLYGVPTVIVFAFFFVLSLGLTFGFVAANGAVAMLVGNGILRAAHLAHYTDNASAAAIGATGAILASMIMGIFMQCMPQDENGQPPWFISLALNVLVATLTGAIGCAILIHNHVDLGPIDVLHATRAGALGGAILGPGMILFVPIFFAALMIVLSPLWLAMMMGLRWVSVRSSESWDGRTHKYSYCYTYGTCGYDPEIEEELAKLPRSRMGTWV